MSNYIKKVETHEYEAQKYRIKGYYMKDLKKIKDNLYKETKIQRKNAWKEKDFKKAQAIRKKEQETYDKWKFVAGLLKANEKEKKND